MGRATTQGSAVSATRGVCVGFQHPLVPSDDQHLAAVAMDSAGGFVVVWAGLVRRTDLGGLRPRVNDRLGSPTGTEFLVNQYLPSLQNQRSVAMDAKGDFAVTWTSYGQMARASTTSMAAALTKCRSRRPPMRSRSTRQPPTDSTRATWRWTRTATSPWFGKATDKTATFWASKVNVSAPRAQNRRRVPVNQYTWTTDAPQGRDGSGGRLRHHVDKLRPRQQRLRRLRPMLQRRGRGGRVSSASAASTPTGREDDARRRHGRQGRLRHHVGRASAKTNKRTPACRWPAIATTVFPVGCTTPTAPTTSIPTRRPAKSPAASGASTRRWTRMR